MSTRNEIERRFAAALLKRGANLTVVGPDSTWAQVGADPFEVVQVIEDQYGVCTRREDLVDVRTVGQAVAFVTGRVVALNRQRVLPDGFAPNA